MSILIFFFYLYLVMVVFWILGIIAEAVYMTFKDYYKHFTEHKHD